ncbi:SDR family NAD(P)-dependent oxidoreductase [Paraburkholderia sp. D1E]|uniref:SDR family NAD(P)-dependent oxidoreductase n=1 Tax=Paraburkholderia sp. D1E TaxID=3461398 RepID=UPI0040457A74
MNLKLEGRRCLVTGASAGIGASIVESLVREGARVVATARRSDALDKFADSIERVGHHRPVTVAGDITEADEVKRIAKEAAAAIGDIEILVNCAGGSRPLPIDASEEAWEESFSLNFTQVRRMTGEVLPAMRRARWGRIINITGIMEPRGINGAIAAKAAVHLWAKGLSRDVAREGITVNNVPPGRIESEQIARMYPPKERSEFVDANVPIGYFGEPSDLAPLVVFLASPISRYITGTVIPVDGGMTYFGAA